MPISPTRELDMEGSVDVGAHAISSEQGDLGIDGAQEERDGSQTGTTPEALFNVLPYLGLKDLLTFEAVSRDLRDRIRGLSTLWRKLHVDGSLSRKLTSAELKKLSNRSMTFAHLDSVPNCLRALSLVKCTRIPELLIEEIVESNPLLEKLNLSGCTSIRAETLLRMLNSKMQTERVPRLKQLRIRGVLGLTPEILDSLLIMMQPEGDGIPRAPQYYKNGEPSPAIPEERTIDVEVCPKCDKVRLVFDCPRPACQQWRDIPLPECRGCGLCIDRCEECGVCVDRNNSEESQETYCMEIVCLPCYLRLPKCSQCNRAGCSRHFEALHVSDLNTFTCDSCNQRIFYGSFYKPDHLSDCR